MILEKAGYIVTVVTGEKEAAYLLAKHRTAAAVLSLPVHLLQAHIFSAVILCHTVPMEERHRIGAMIRRTLGARPRLLVLHRSGYCSESLADAAVDSRDGQERILAALAELIEGNRMRRLAAVPLHVEYVGAGTTSQQEKASGKKTKATGLPLFEGGRFAV
ncbi:MAG: hypothetical protein ABI383_09255 [Acidobacteriaceae bacterium]